MALINTTTTGVLGTTIFGDGAGALTVQQNGVTQGIFGNQPAFHAYASAAQAFTLNTYTKVTFDIKLFDTNNNFTSSRFTPTVSGYYQISAGSQMAGTASIGPVIVKNNSFYIYGTSTPSISYPLSNMSVLIYFNGTTDYVDYYITSSASLNTSPSTSTSQTVYFSGILVKAA